MLSNIIYSFEKYTDRNAFCINGKNYTYGQLHQLVCNIISLLNHKCAKNEKIVGIAANNDIYTYASILAIWFSGKGYLPVHPGMPAERNLNIIQQAGAETLLTGVPGNLPVDSSAIKQVLDTSSLTDVPVFTFDPLPDQKSLAYLLFTSGSTGVPKGVPITFENLKSFVDAFFSLGYNISEEDRFLQMFDLTFDLSVISYLIPICRGACVYTVPHEGMKYTNVYSILQNSKITFAMLVPSVISFLRPYFEDVNLPDMKYSLFCGEPLYEDVTREWQKCVPNAEIHNVYGPTETTVFCITYFANFTSDVKSYNGIICIGQPMNNIHAVICDDKGNLLGHDEKGELCLGGTPVMAGYWKNPSKTESAFFMIDSGAGKIPYYRTGDIAFTDTDGNFYFCGRADNQVKIQGYRVELAEIEFAARKYLHDKNVVAATREDKNGNHEIFLYVENFNGDQAQLRDAMKEFLPSYMLPEEIIDCPQFPLNPNGKVDRKKLKEWINAR